MTHAAPTAKVQVITSSVQRACCKVRSAQRPGLPNHLSAPPTCSCLTLRASWPLDLISPGLSVHSSLEETCFSCTPLLIFLPGPRLPINSAGKVRPSLRTGQDPSAGDGPAWRSRIGPCKQNKAYTGDSFDSALGFSSGSTYFWWLSGKESACQAGDAGSVPGLGRSFRGGNGNPLQYSCLENPIDRGSWQVPQRVGHYLATKQ